MSMRHLPASHPVLQRAAARVLTPLTPSELSNLSDRLDVIAAQVAELPEQPLTVRQRASVRIVARELLRRADRCER